MILDKPHVFESKNKKIKLVAESFEEPAAGRTFWKYKFYIENKLVTNTVLNYENEGLFNSLDLFTLESDDGSYVYIPKYNPVVYSTSKRTFKEFKAPLKNGGTDFVKNLFHNNELIIVYRNGIVIIDLNFEVVKTFEYSEEDVFIEDLKITPQGEMELDYRDLKHLEFKKEIINI